MLKIIFSLCILSTSFVFGQTSKISRYNKKKDLINKEIDSITALNKRLTELKDSLKAVNDLQKDSIKTSENLLNEKNEKLKCQKIGNQYWMKQNLQVLTLNNGDKLKEAKTTKEWNDCFNDKIPAYCYHKKDSLKQNGVLYNIHALNSGLLAPQGYSIPSKKDIDALISSFNSLKDSASFFLKSDEQHTWTKKGLDLFEMNIKPIGFRLSDGLDWYYGDKVYYFCSSSIKGSQTLDLFVFSEFSNKIYFLNRNSLTDNVNYGLYVRCIYTK